MRAECLPLESVPHVSPLYKDYLSDFSRVSAFYPSNPCSPDYKKLNSLLDYPDERRRRVADILERQNKGWGASSKTLHNVNRLRDGAAALVTGQQVSLFGGPLFSYLKAISAVLQAQVATKAGVSTVPIFWLATEDHDLAEVSVAKCYGAGSSIHTLALAAEPGGSSVGQIIFGNNLKPLVEEAVQLLGDSEVAGHLRECYMPGTTFGDAFAKLFSRLFADYGIIFVDARDVELHKISAPIYQEAAKQAKELNAALIDRSKELVSAGYHAQVKVSSSSTLLFADEKGARTAVHASNGGFSIGKRKVSVEKFLEEIAKHPELFSANALMRPVIQDFLLPTLAYIGGPAEVAYFAQSAVVYQKLLQRVTPILPRISATLVEEKIQKRLKQYQLQVSDVWSSAGDLQTRLAKASLPESLMNGFAEARQDVQHRLDKISGDLAGFDKTLVDASKKSNSKIMYQLGRLESRAARAAARKNQDVLRHAQQLNNTLWPNKQLQEREIAGITFLARGGTGLLKEIYDSVQTDCPGHQVLYL